MSDTGWFGRMGVAKLARAQQNLPGGISATMRTMIAAYKQFDDIEVLLAILKTMPLIDPTGDQAVQFAKIVERHEKYREAQADEVIS